MFTGKKNGEKQSEEEKVKNLFKNNAIKRMVEEKKKKNQEELLREQEREKQRMTSSVDYVFNVGERVFHEKLGVGHIADVMTIGESIMYTIDFGKMGKKAMAAEYAKLKKF